MTEIWDYIIVGAGSAGCVLANRLSADPSISVLLLEAGGRNNALDIRIPAGLTSAIFKDRYNWKYPAAPDASRDHVVDSWSGGKGLGGSSSINGMLFIRGSKADYDGWSDLGCSGWDYESVLPHFCAIESFQGSPDDYRGDAGPVSVSFPPVRSALIDAWILAAQNCGHRLNPDYNAAAQLGVANAQASIRKGRRHCAAEAFLAPVMGRPNLEVRTGSQATRIHFEGERAASLEYLRDGRCERVACAGEIIVSCGAIGSPRLLMHSGIGPDDVLSENGIPVVRDVARVGANLMEHPAAYVKACTTLPSFNRAGRWHRLPWVLLDWLLRGKGPAAAGTAVAQVLAASSRNGDTPELQLLLSLANFTINPGGDGVSLSRQDGFSMACCLMTPTSRGRVKITSDDPLAQPLVEHAMLACEEDLDRLAEAAKQALRILTSEPLKEFVTEIDFPLDAQATREEWHAYLRQAAFRADHPSGTCGMGPDSASVVDPRLRVNGVQRLRVVDASIIPVIPRANTNAPVMMIADKAATMIEEDRRRQA